MLWKNQRMRHQLLQRLWMNGPNTSSDWNSTAKINAGKCWAKMENKVVRLRERDSGRERERNRIVGQSPKDEEWDGEREREREMLGEDGEWDGGRERCLAKMENGNVRERENQLIKREIKRSVTVRQKWRTWWWKLQRESRVEEREQLLIRLQLFKLLRNTHISLWQMVLPLNLGLFVYSCLFSFYYSYTKLWLLLFSMHWLVIKVKIGSFGHQEEDWKQKYLMKINKNRLPESGTTWVVQLQPANQLNYSSQLVHHLTTE